MLKKLTQKRNRKGFTLVELVVVIAILGILAAIAVPRLSGTRNQAGLAADRASAASIAKAAELYVASQNISLDKIITGEKVANANVTIAKLKSADLITNDLKPQVSNNDFVLTYGKLKKGGTETKDAMFYVTYETAVDGIDVLYPEGFTK